MEILQYLLNWFVLISFILASWLLGIYSNDIVVQMCKYIWRSVFITALFILKSRESKCLAITYIKLWKKILFPDLEDYYILSENNRL